MEYYARDKVSSFPDLSLYPAEGEVYSECGEDITYDVDYVSNQDMKEW
jgi:hypothetical protein